MNVVEFGDVKVLVTTNDAAAACGVDPSTIRAWVHRGHLKPWMPNLEDVEEGRVVLPDNYDPKRHRFVLIDVLKVARDTRRRAIGPSRRA